MRSGKNPNYEQKLILTRAKKDATEWLLVKNDKDSYTFRHKKTNELVTLSK